MSQSRHSARSCRARAFSWRGPGRRICRMSNPGLWLQRCKINQESPGLKSIACFRDSRENMVQHLCSNYKNYLKSLFFCQCYWRHLSSFLLLLISARSGTHMVFYPDGGKYTGHHLSFWYFLSSYRRSRPVQRPLRCCPSEEWN